MTAALTAQRLAAICAARDAGTDCTEDESAALKRHLREHPCTPLAARIREAFPVEADEAAAEGGES